MHFPLKRKIIKDSQPSSKSWITSEVRESSVRLRDLFRLKCKYPIFGEQYKSERRKHSNLVLQSRRSYYRSKILDSDNAIKGTWKVSNSRMGGTRT